MQILIVKLSSMGDIVSTLPAVTDAKKAIPDINIDWVVEENFIEIPSWHFAVNATIPFALRRWRKKLFNIDTMREARDFCQRIKLKQYDYILDVQGLLKSAIVSRTARGIRCGFNVCNVRESLASVFYQRKFSISKNLHAVERSRQLFAAALGYKITGGNPDYGIMQEKFCRNNKITEKYLVFVHGASRNNKCWQEGKWAELARLAKIAGFKVKLPWGNDLELTRAKNIAASSDNIEVLPKTSLTKMIEVLVNAKGVVALDTGFSHLSAALSVPTVSLYGPTNPKLAGTYGKNQFHLTNMGSLDAHYVWEKMQQEV